VQRQHSGDDILKPLGMVEALNIRDLRNAHEAARGAGFANTDQRLCASARPKANTEFGAITVCFC